MATNDYCTAEDLKEWVGSTSGGNQAVFERAVTAASRAIDHHCQRHFWQDAAETRVFDTCDSTVLGLGEFNDLVAIDASGLKTDDNGDGTFETTWLTTDYQLLPLRPLAAPEQQPTREIRTIASRRFPTSSASGRQGLIQITGTWGWPAVPTDVSQACLILAARYYKRKESPEGVAGMADFGQIRISRQDSDVVALLGPYQLAPLHVA